VRGLCINTRCTLGFQNKSKQIDLCCGPQNTSICVMDPKTCSLAHVAISGSCHSTTTHVCGMCVLQVCVSEIVCAFVCSRLTNRSAGFVAHSWIVVLSVCQGWLRHVMSLPCLSAPRSGPSTLLIDVCSMLAFCSSALKSNTHVQPFVGPWFITQLCIDGPLDFNT
jgi:hypothetical protein